MTTDSSAERSAIEQTRPLRLPIALVLLLVNLFWLLISIEQFLIPRDAVNEFDTPAGFAGRARSSFLDFAGLSTLLLPLVAVLLVTHFKPVVQAAKLVVTIALGQYAVSALFAVIAFVGAFFYKSTYTDSQGRTTVYYTWRSAVEDGFTRLGSLLLLGVVLFVVLRIALGMFRSGPKPDRFAAYGRQSQPPYGGQPAHGGQPAYGAPPAHQRAPQPHGQQPAPPVAYPPQVSGPPSPQVSAQHGPVAPAPQPPYPVSAPPQGPASPYGQPPQQASSAWGQPVPDDEQRTQMISPEEHQRAEEARRRAFPDGER